MLIKNLEETKGKFILITPGEPAGIGPDITIQIAQQSWPAKLIVLADPDLLLQRAKQIGLPLKLNECDHGSALASIPGMLNIIPIKLKTSCQAGKLNPDNASYVIETLSQAASLCMNKKVGTLVTGPVHKETINAGGLPFTGHTEFFADYCHVAKTVMLFVIREFKVALATTHLPLKKVADAINKESLMMTLAILNSELKEKFCIQKPRILICGLNPHAGENGYLGREEIEVISPLIKELNAKDYHLQGPLPADTIFTPYYLNQADAILAMYHDQALPLVKYLGFGHAINVTLGLPFVRTSVDHGTAVDKAGKDGVDAGSMVAAINLAIKLSITQTLFNIL